ncbi:MAG: outer membrane lipoprotein-sorting protein [Opitutaceae bacterium]
MPELMIAPAVTWRAFFIYALLGMSTAVAAPGPAGNQSPGTYVQFGQPDQVEGRKVLAQFRQAGIAGEYFLEFDLRVMPRRGDEKLFHGRLWGSRNEQGAVLRVAVTDAAGQNRRLLIQNGDHPAVWRSDSATDTAHRVNSFEPLVPGVELTAFDLQMPFIYWPDAVLESVSRMRSRPAHVFLFRPPADWAAQHPDISGVRAYLDTQFNAPVQTELLDQNGRVLRTLSLVDLKKIGDQYIVKSVDLRNDTTRDKTRFQVTAAALGLEFSSVVFEPARLTDEIRPPAAAKLTRVTP